MTPTPSLSERIFTPWGLLIFFTSINMLTYFDRGLLSSAIVACPSIASDPLIVEGLNFTNCDDWMKDHTGPGKEAALPQAKEGLLGSAFMGGFMVFCPIFANLADRINPLMCITIGELIWIAAVFGCAFAPSFEFLLFSRLLVGAGEASFAGLAPRIIDDSSPPESRSNRIGIFYAMIAVGTALGYSVGGFVVHNVSIPALGVYGTGWRVAFMAQGVIMLPLAIAVLFVPRKYIIPKTHFATTTLTVTDGADAGTEAAKVIVVVDPAAAAPSEFSAIAATAAGGDAASEPVATTVAPWPAAVAAGGASGAGAGASAAGAGSSRPRTGSSRVRRGSHRADSPTSNATSEAMSMGGGGSGGSADSPLLAHRRGADDADGADAADEVVEPVIPFPIIGRGTVSDPNHIYTLGGAIKALFTNPFWFLLSFGYSCYTFVVGGLSFWLIKFSVEVGMTGNTGSLVFGGVTVVAGIFGTAAGGFILDRIGGSSGTAGVVRSTKLAFFAIVIALPLMVCAFLVSSSSWRASIVYVFFGELVIFAITSPVNTALLTVVPTSLRAYAMGFNVFIIHLFGDFPSPTIIGWLAQRFFGGSLRLALMSITCYLLVTVIAWGTVSWKATQLHKRAVRGEMMPLAVAAAQADDYRLTGVSGGGRYGGHASVGNTVA